MGVAGTGQDRQRADVVEFWRTIELMSPQTLDRPRLDRGDREPGMRRLPRDRPAPWEPGHQVADQPSKPRRVWQHVVYIGVFEHDHFYSLLDRALSAGHRPLASDADHADERRPGGSSAIAAVVLSSEGRPLLQTPALASCTWALGRALTVGPSAPGWLDGMQEAEARFRQQFEEWAAPPADDLEAFRLRGQGHPVGRMVGSADIRRWTADVVELLGLEGVSTFGGQPFVSDDVWVRSELVPVKRAYKEDEQDFLNSFIADDLRRVARHVREGRYGTALRDYLRLDDEISRDRYADVEDPANLPTVYDALAPGGIPLGRWPSPVDQPLATGQQFAVNRALAELGPAASIFGVNGPPGTGKTTMLRDLVAALVVERACRLAELPRAADAFGPGGPTRIDVQGQQRNVAQLDARLTGFEMVVASSNNGAVENVTREIPAVEALGDAWQSAAATVDYHSDLATFTLNADRLNDPATSWTAAGWGLVAARLGHMGHRRNFAKAFWWGEFDDGDEPGRDRRPGLRRCLETGDWDSPRAWSAVQGIAVADDGRSTIPSWSTAVAAFRRALDAARALRDERAQVRGDLRDLGPAERGLADAAAVEQEATDRIAGLRDELRAWARANVELSEAVAGARELHAEHRRDRPGLLETIFTLGRAMRAWSALYREEAQRLRAASGQLSAAAAALTAAEAAVDVAQEALATASEQRRLAQQRYEILHSRVASARSTLGAAVPGPGWWDTTPEAREARELNAPWTDPAWNEARSRLFLEALALHKAFLQLNAGRLLPNLRTAVDILEGRAPTLPADAALAAWQSLFLVVPVVSTTFASFARMFSHLGPESLGWLLVDEAGQATPQNVVGALWRSRRMLAVGDPLQLEPVSTLGLPAQETIRAEHRVEPKWLPALTSVQRLADQLTPCGTWLDQGRSGENRVWVGAPLKVHRRCDEPMFGVVNDAVYGGLMIFATPPAQAIATDGTGATLHVPDTGWFDVAPDVVDGHWVEGEGDVLDGLLDQLVAQGVAMREVFALTPFRDIARRLETRARSGPRARRAMRAGTVHRAQGKEADVVVLVLGCHPDEGRGAMRWAASTPNLLNVAVSRARRRLYVIGNRSAWRRHRYFDTLADRLPRL